MMEEDQQMALTSHVKKTTPKHATPQRWLEN